MPVVVKPEIWKPNVTVAAVVEQNGRFLLVAEETAEGVCFNQPAGHLEKNESLIDAVVRETLEETAYTFKPTFLLGVYQWAHPKKDVTYLRFAFGGELLSHDPTRTLDDGIIAAHWLTLDEILASQSEHRSPLVLRCAQDLAAGIRFPLSAITHDTESA